MKSLRIVDYKTTNPIIYNRLMEAISHDCDENNTIAEAISWVSTIEGPIIMDDLTMGITNSFYQFYAGRYFQLQNILPEGELFDEIIEWDENEEMEIVAFNKELNEDYYDGPETQSLPLLNKLPVNENMDQEMIDYRTGVINPLIELINSIASKC